MDERTGPTPPHFHYLGSGPRRNECTSELCWLVIDTGLVYFKD